MRKKWKVQVLNQEKEKWMPRIDELIGKYVDETEAQIADRVSEMVVAEACNILKPIHQREAGILSCSDFFLLISSCIAVLLVHYDYLDEDLFSKSNSTM